MTTILGNPKKRGSLTRLALLFAIVTMLALVTAAPASAADAVYESHTTGDNSMLGFYYQWQAQTFTTTSAHNVNAVSLKLSRVSTCTGTMTVSIRATDADGLPTGGDLCYGTIDVTQFTDSYSGAWYKIPMTSSYSLNDSTKYAILVRKNTWGTENVARWHFSRGDLYSGGSSYVEDDGTGTEFRLYGIGLGFDFMFQIHGDPPADNEAPTINLNQDPTGWTNGDVTITATVADSGSGVDAVKWAAGELTAGDFAEVTTTLTSSTNDYAFDVSTNGWYTVYAKDVAGNEAVNKIQINNIDKSAPDIALSQDPDDWTNGDVTITATVEDSGTDVAVVKWAAGQLTAGDFAAVTTTLTSSTDNYAFDVSTNGWYTVYAKDYIGNEDVNKIQISNIDKVAPTITTIEGSVYNGGPVNLGYIAKNFDKKVPYAATDNLSGFASSGTTSETGSFTINTGAAGLGLSKTCYVTDRAGNQSSITFNYNVLALDDFMGMLKPVNDGGVYKRNRNLPVKLSIFDGSGIEQRMSAGELTFKLKLCKLDGTDWVEIPFSRTNSSNLSYAEFELSSDGYQYKFNLDTKGLDLGEYKLEILIPDGGSCGFIGFTLR